MSSLAPLHRSDTDLSAAGLGAALARAVAPARLAAAGLLVVFVGLFALPLQAQAQTVTTFVSNTAQGPGGASNDFQAQRFATGTNTGGYTISEVQVRLNTTATRSTSVKIRENNATNKPGDLVATLTNPGTLTGGSDNTFTAPPDTTLDASTNYWISVNEGITISGDRASVTRTTSNVETGETGWSIDNNRLSRNSETANWITQSTGTLVIAVKGTANPTTTSSDATLSALTLSKGTLSPTFSSDVTTYTASVGDSVSRIKVTGTAADDANASVAYLDVDGNLLTAAGAADGHQVDLDVGDNVIQVQVTAEDTTTETYTVTVTRAEIACTAPDLSGRAEVWTATMTAGLGEDGDFFGYSTSQSDDGTLSDTTIDYRGSSYIIRDIRQYFSEENLLSFILNKPFPADDRDRLRLHVCGDALDLVNAEEVFDGNYTWDPTDFPWSTGITVSLALSATASSDANLSALTLSDGMLSPSFASDVTDYTASAANAASRITVTAARSDSAADIDYLDGDGDELTDLDPGTDGHQVDLVVGENVIQVKLTAEDGTTKTYKVTVTRAAGVSTDANLSALTLSKGTLSPSFASDVIAYAASVGDSVSRITVTAARSDSDAGIAYLDGDGDELADLDPGTDGHQVDLVVGANTIKVKVTAGDGATTKTYTVTVTRAAQSNTDATLSAIALAHVNGAAIALSPAFASNVIDYTASVPVTAGEITITVATRDSAATVQFGVDVEDDDDFGDPYETVADGYRIQTALDGSNVIQVKVTAGDGTTTKTYTVTVSLSGTEFTCLPPDLSGRTEVWTGTLTVGSDSDLYGYSVPLGYGALPNTSFDYRENSYTIKEIYEYGESTGTPSWMVLTLDPYFPNSERDTMRLHLCNDTFDLGEAGGNQPLGNYAWVNSFLDWSLTTTIEMALTADNVAPVFEDGATASRGFDEDLDPGEPFGTPVIATDDETLVYSLEGTDAALFDIGADGVLLTRAGESYDHETKSSYEITVKADDGKGETATIAVTVNVGDVDEPPEAPAEPTVTPVAGSTTSLSVTWTEPSNKGPDIQGYDLRYRVTGTSGWTDGPEDVTATTETLPGLAEGTSYGVQVLATNAEGDGEWSVEGTGRTGANTPATGKPSISGAAQVGQTLTAGIGDIADTDDLPSTVFPAGYTFQWVRVDSSNSETDVGTDSSTYSPTSSDVGSTIKVEVSFTDGGGNAETVTSDATVAVVAAAGPCPAGNDWCTTMTVGVSAAPITLAGYAEPAGRGALDDTAIDYGSKSFTVAYLHTSTGLIDQVSFGIDDAVEYLPSGSVFNFGGTEFTADASSEHIDVGQYQWDRPANFGWIEGQKVTVSANLAPAPESATVDGTSLVLTHAEDLDTGSTPAASAYVVKLDGGTGPAVSGVSVSTRTVTLTLATAVTAADTVTVDYDAPASNRLRDVSGLDAPASDNFPVTNNTGATNSIATGKPGISGTAAVGQTLTATTSGISDTDGKTKAEDGDSGYAYTYQWILVDGNTETDISGETSSTYTPSSSDVGKTIRVRVSFTDDLDNAEDSLTSEQTAAVTAVTVAVSIAADHDRIGAGLEDLVFTLTRQGATTDALEATVTIDQGQPWLGNSDLSKTVTFTAGSATATLTLGASRFSFDPETAGNLTATVSGAGIAGGEATVEVVSTADPAITVSYDMSSYTFAEDAADVNIYVVVALDPAYPRAPSRSFYLSFSSNSDTAISPGDYGNISWQPQFVQGDFALDVSKFVARKRLRDTGGAYFGVEDDDVYEGSERLGVILERSPNLPSGLVQFVRPNGDTCEALSCSPLVEYTVIITDEEDRPVLSLSADPASITEEDDDTTTSVTENVSTLTVAAASPKTFATEQTITLTFGGTAVYGTHYSVNPADADANAMGHQVLLLAETPSVQVTVTAAGNDTADGNRLIEVAGSLDGTAFGNTTIALVDDETTTTNTAATGQPGISGTAAVGQTLTATTLGITDADGKTKAEDGDSGYAYTYQWILVDGNTETDISGETSSTYTPSSSDVGKTIRVKVSFTDDADNAEVPLTSDQTLTVIEVAAAGICGRTLAVRAAILNKISSVSDCANVTDTHLAAITGGLPLSSRNVTALAVGDFAGLDALTRLNLSSNTLTTLPAGVFGGLDALTLLRLDDNALTTLPDGVFGGLDALTELRLYNNALTTLPDGVFAGLDMLTTLSLSNSGLDALPDGVFAPLTALTTLYLSSNGLATLPAGVFAGLDALTKLRLNDNALTALPAGVFAGLTALTTLWLNNNALTALPAGVFAGLDMLTTLWLDDNALTALPDDVFEPLTALTELKLTNNSRESFAPEAVALPDDGTVSDEGGTVTLDGSGSGGAWGTNVTYGWALTEPASGVTFDDDTSVTPKVTVPSLPEDTELTFTLTVTGRGGTDGILPGTDTAKVRVTRADNTAPTASDSSVTTNEDTAHLFAASDFNFDDTDTDDTLASVTVVTLPTAGVLALNGTAVTAGDTVTKIQLDANQLTFMPAADGNGDAYASFTFRVSDGTDESAADYSMTVNVTAVNDAATGKPTIEGTAQAGKELTATTSGITDVDGNTKAENGDTGYAYTYQWVLVDGGAETDISGETSSTYTPSSSDVGKTIKVKVSFTDDLGSAEGPLTSDATVAVVTVAVSIAAEYASIGAGLEDLVFNLTREGAATDALEATVTIVQDQPWLGTSDLSHTVSFTAGSATATLTLGASRFSFDPETAGNLTATVAVAGVSSGEATVEMVSTADPAITISYDKSSYTFAEDATDVEIYVLATLDTAYPRAPSRSFQIALSTESDTAIFRQDFVSIIWAPQFVHGDYELDGNRFVARKRLQADDGAYFGVLDYDIYEGSERLFVNIDRGSGFVLGMTQFQNPDGTTCEPGSGCTPKYPVFITDEEDRPVLSLSAVPASIAEEDDDTTMNVAENVSVLTVAAASPKTFATEQTITLTFGGTAVYGVHYSVNPADADANTGGHQVLLPAETPSVQVTVTAAGNDTADGHRSILVTGSLDGTEFDRTSVAVADNETTTNTAATGQPMISGTAQVGQMLTASTSGISDNDGLTGVSYSFQWVREDADGSNPADIGTDSSTYTLMADDEGKKVKVEVSFTDDGGASETVTSDVYPSSGTITPGTPTSTDATLSGLTLQDGEGAFITLSPAFDSATVTYTASVLNGIDKVTLTAAQNDSTATVAIANDDDTNKPGEAVLDLIVGTNTLTVTVTAEDGSTKTYTVTVTRAAENTAPTATDSSVTIDEDTAHTFAASEFNFDDTDAGDTLASVTVVTLPAAGALALNGTAVTAGDTVTKIQLDANQLTFMPATDGNGDAYASFTFRVSDGTDESAADYSMTVNVTAVNAATTGQPTIMGTSQVGQELTAGTSDIMDVDGVPSSFTYQWVRVDSDGASNEMDIGSNSDTYTLLAADVGKKVKVKVTFTDNGGTAETVTSDAYPSGVGTIVAVGDPVNADPVFNDGTSTTRSVAENTAAGTDIGAAVSATDAENDSLEYTLEGADLASFDIVLGTGQLQTKMGVDYNHEAAKNSYSVTVKADDGNGGTDTIAVTVNVTDVDEKAARPARPTVTATPGTTDSLNVSWTKPDLAGGPEIIGYELQHRITGQGNWNTTTPPGTGTMSTIGGLTTGTEYSVQVRARNGETTSDWSEAGEGTPGTATAAGVTVTETALTVAEEDTTGDSYTVVLDTRPTASVTVTVGGHSGTDVTPYPATLMFTVLNWDTARTVTVTAGDDVDTANDTVLLTHSATSTDRNYRGIVIAEVTVTVNDNDTARVTVVTGVHLASGPGPDGVWRAGDTVEAVVEFSEAVTVDTSGGEPALAIEFGAQRREAVYARGSGTAALVFHHVVVAADDGARAARVVAGGLSLNGATISNAAGVDAVLGFVLAPAVTSVAVAPDPDGDGRWSPGEAVTVTVGFSDEVAVDTSGGTPSVAVLAGGGEREAVYSTGSGTATLRFAYTVLADDGAVTSVQAPANGLALNGGAIVGPTGLAAALAHVGASRTGTPAAPALSVAEGGTLVFAVTLDRAAAAVVVVDWATGDGTARAGEDYAADSGKIAFVPGETLRTVRVAVLEDDEAEGAETMELTLSNATGAGLADATATGRVSDPAGEQPAVSVADAKVRESPGAVLAFKVTLDRVSRETATVDWETLNGGGKAGAKAGQDYVADSGTLVFVPGETAKTVNVAVLDDSHDEGQEVMLLILSNAVRATIADGAAKGIIENSDHMPKAWLARFGRTVAEQVLDAVEDRLRAAPRAGVEARLAGEAVASWDGGSRPGGRDRPGSGEEAELSALTDWLRDDPDPWSGADSGDGRWLTLRSRAVTSRDFLTGTSFAMTKEAAGGAGLVSLWGRGALTRFDGRERGPNGDLTLEGEVGSAMLGADWTGGAGFRPGSGAGAWTAGLLLAHSRGEGSYRGEVDGTGDTGGTEGAVLSSVTGLYPYGRYRVTDRVTLWGVAGYGAGTLTLTPQDADGKAVAPLRTDMELMMASLGVRGVAVEAPAEGGFELAGTSDAMVVRTSSEKTSGLAAATGDVTRLRLGLEGVWRGLAFGGHELEPSLEVGIRHDGGDAETGFGADIGAGLAWSHANSGVSAEVSARGLLTHAAGGFREQGIAGSLTWDPRPETERGALLTLRQTMGAQASGGMDALLGHTTLAGLTANDDDELQNRRLELKLGYGFPVFSDRFTSTPEIELGFSDRARDYSLGWRLTLARRAAGTLELGVVATRREHANDEPRHVIGFQLTARW